MPSAAIKLLAHDHAALDNVLCQLQAALNSGEVDSSHATLDLFWARLAVHIRAEHNHLFPAVMSGVNGNGDEQTFALTVREVQSTVKRLRADHDFFMHELAQAIGVMRELLKTTNPQTVDDGMRKAQNAVVEIEKRLNIHNELEENTIYAWAANILNEHEQTNLATRINAELTNRPPRFSLTTWSRSRHTNSD